jgi:hypothetical protein
MGQRRNGGGEKRGGEVEWPTIGGGGQREKLANGEKMPEISSEEVWEKNELNQEKWEDKMNESDWGMELGGEEVMEGGELMDELQRR